MDTTIIQPPQLEPHRGGIILAFGLVGMFVCIPFAVVAWAMASDDLLKMHQGRMDPAGRGMTEAGRIIGIIATCLHGVAAVAYSIMAIIFGSAMFFLKF
jgi:hypothetical protein